MVEDQKNKSSNGATNGPEQLISQIAQMAGNFHDHFIEDVKLLQTEIEKILLHKQQLENDLEQNEQQNEKLAQEISENQAEFEKQNQHINQELKSVQKQANNEISNLQSQLIISEEESRELREILNSAHESLKDFKSDCADLNQQNKQLLLEKEDIEDQINILRKKHQKLDKRHAVYKKQKIGIINKLRKENKEQIEDNKTVVDQRNLLKEEFSQQEEKFQILLDENDILKSEKEVLSIELEKIDERAQREQVQSRVEMITQLSDHLSKLSVLAGEEPQEVMGLNIESVYKDLLDWIASIIGEKPKPFPNSGDCDPDGTLWLDAEQEDLTVLIEKYDWSNIRPFENLPDGDRFRPFRVMRRGWQVNGKVLKRAKIKLIDIE